MKTYEQIMKRILEIVLNASNQRIRPHALQKALRKEFDISIHDIKNLLNNLVDEKVLVFTYRDPCSYVEIPVMENHHAARPMKVIRDHDGEYWICDTDVDPEKDPAEQGCWRCGDLAFTRND